MSKLLPIAYSPDAQKELDEIMDWNEKYYDRAHAERYLKFLLHQIGVLCRDPKKGQQIPTRPGLLFVIIRRGSTGHGHIAVYQRMTEIIEVLHVFHTAQDWQQRLHDESSPE